MKASSRINIFTDGASRGNPGPGGWGSIVVYKDKVNELGGRDKMTTNNRMELMAVIKSLEFLDSAIRTPRLAVIYTDSAYVLNAAKTWVHVWAKNGWRTKTKQKVENQDLWRKFLKLTKGGKIDWRLLSGHSGIPANERCDRIATAFADGKKPHLYSGILGKYPVSFSVPSILKAKSSKPKARSSKAKAYSYLSLVRGVIKTHKTWVECERRVKGVSGAKFKKAFSHEDEKEIVRQWKQNSLL